MQKFIFSGTCYKRVIMGCLQSIPRWKEAKCGIIYAILFSFALVLSAIVRPIAWGREPYKQSHIPIFNIKNVLFVFIIFVIILFLWKILFRSWNKVIFLKENTEKNVFRKTFVFVLSSWSVAWMIHFPGTGMNDTVNIIKNAINDIQPLFHSLLINMIMHKVESITGSMLIGYATFVLLQMVLFALIVAYTAKWLSEKCGGVRKEVLMIYSVFFAVTPIVANYAIVIVKDSMYSYATLMILPCLIDIMDTKGAWIKDRRNDLLFTVVLIVTAFTRSHGEIIALIIVIGCIIKLSGFRSFFVKDLILLVLISELLATVKRNSPLEDVRFRDAMSIPMVQIAAVVSNEGIIQDEQMQALEKIAPLHIWKDKYSFSIVDPIKYNSEFDNQTLNENKVEFLRLWFELGVQNIPLYIKSYLFHTYGFWNLNSSNQWIWFGGQSIFFSTCNNTSDEWWNEYVAEQGFENKGIFGNGLSEILKEIYRFIFTFFGGGQMFWILLLLVSFCLQKKSPNIAVYGVLLLNWFSLMVAAPSSYPYRYVFWFVVALPFLLIYFKIVNERHVIALSDSVPL